MALEMDRLLSLARSRRVFFHLINQGLAQILRVDPALVRSLKTNVNRILFFRGNREDAQAFSSMVPEEKGRQQLGPAFRPGRHNVLLDAGQLVAQSSYTGPSLLERLTSLEDRAFYLWLRTKPYPGRKLRSLNVQLPEPTMDQKLLRELKRGSMALTADQARAQADKRRQALEPRLHVLPPTLTPAAETATGRRGAGVGRAIPTSRRRTAVHAHAAQQPSTEREAGTSLMLDELDTLTNVAELPRMG